MKISTWLTDATKKLEAAGISSARLDTLILLEDFTGKERSWLLANFDYTINDTFGLDDKIQRRASHEPLAYIRGKSEFFGRTFTVTRDTLQPRPETETMIELLLEMNEGYNFETVIDVGTGSGCIAITVKLELPLLSVIATDNNRSTLNIAKQNSRNLKADISFLKGNLLDPVTNISSFDVVLANLPYVPDAHMINQAASFEPAQAIFGGKDGLDLYRELFKDLEQHQLKPTLVLTESLPFQHAALIRIAEGSGYTLVSDRDLTQVFSAHYS